MSASALPAIYMNMKQHWSKMPKFLIFLFLLSFFIHIHARVIVDYPYRACLDPKFTRNGTTYLPNLTLLSSFLSSNASHRSYYNATVGGGRRRNPTVYGHFQCKGDIDATTCEDCVATATSSASQQFCPLSTGAVIWFDLCLLRYSSTPFFSVVSKEPSLVLVSSEKIEDDDDSNDSFDQLVVSTLSGSVGGANASSFMFGTKEAAFKNEMIYSLAQCTGDLSTSKCGECLRDALENFPDCCSKRKGGRVLFPSCTVRYELYAFYNVVTLSPSPVPSPSGPSSPPPEPSRGSVPPPEPSRGSVPPPEPSRGSVPPPSESLPPPASTSSLTPSMAAPLLSGKSRAVMVVVMMMIGIFAASSTF